MKIRIAILIGINIWLISPRLMAQTVTYSSNRNSISELFDQLGKQTGYSFLLEDGVISYSQKINIAVKNASLEQVLDLALHPLSLTFHIDDKIVYILKSTPSGKPQASLKGRVVNQETGKPIASVSVYLNNTSIGTITNDRGYFIINDIPSGKFRLVVSSIGFETYVKLIDPQELSGEIIISLKPKIEELQDVVARPFEPDGWTKWGKLFSDIFIGTGPNAMACNIENPAVIKFRLNSDNTLTAYAKESILIRNSALGYEIKYKMEEFEYNLSSKVVTYNGYAFFTDLALSHPGRREKWEEKRQETYEGSLMHFMRSYFVDRLGREGFEMRSLAKISNPEKDRAKYLFSIHKDSLIIDTVSISVDIQSDPLAILKNPYITKRVNYLDSTDYFRNKLREPDSVISHQLILADSIGFAVDSSTAGLYYPDSLEVSYKLKEIPNAYRKLSKYHKHETYPLSQFVFVNKKPVYDLSNGFYYGPHDLKITGYWAWSETMATLLPYDYQPLKK